MRYSMNKIDFFNKYPNLKIEEFEKLPLTWDDLLLIYDDYKKSEDDFKQQAELLFKKIITFRHVHSCKFRVKDPEHLIEKIIKLMLFY